MPSHALPLLSIHIALPLPSHALPWPPLLQKKGSLKMITVLHFGGVVGALKKLHNLLRNNYVIKYIRQMAFK